MTLSAWIKPTATPERLADHPAERRPTPTSSTPATTPARCARRVAATFGGSTSVRERSDGQPGQRLDPRGPDLRRHHHAAVRQRRAGRQPRATTGAIQTTDQPAVDRRQQPLRRVLPGPDRRGPRLQPGAHPGRDPDRHGHSASGPPPATRRRRRRRPRARPPRLQRRPGQPERGRPRPTTSASPATGSSAARARAAPTSPRSARRPRPPSRHRPVGRDRPTATGCGRSMPPATSAPTRAIATATHRHAPTRRRRPRPPGSRPRRQHDSRIEPGAGRPRPTTSASPATGSSAARARAAPPSPRSARRPTTTFSDTGLAPSSTLPLPGPRGRRRRQPQRLLDRRHGDDAAAADTTAPIGARPALIGHGDRQQQPDRPGLDGVDRQRRRHRLPRGALPGRRLHQLRPGRHADRHDLQRHRALALDDLPLPGACGRRGRQPQRLLRDRHGDDARRGRHDARRRRRRRSPATAVEHDPDRPGLDGLDRQRRRHRLPGRALPGRELHHLRAGRDADGTTFSDTGLRREHDLPLPGAGGRRGRQPQRLLRHRHATTLADDTHAADGADGARRDGDRPDAGSTWRWTASTDNVGVTGYRVERCQGAGCTTFAQVGTPTGDHLQRHRPVALDDLPLPGARDRRRRQPQRLLARSRPRRRRPLRHDAAVGADRAHGDRDRRAVRSTWRWTASTDNVGVTGYRVERCQGAGCTDLRPDRARPTATTFSDTGLRRSTTYRYRVRAVDAAGNLSAYSAIARPPPAAAPAAPPGLVGAWAFDEGAGTTTADASGNGQRRDPDRRQLDHAGPLRQRPELQRHQQPGPGRRFGFARPDHCDDPLGLDPADGQPERLADHPAARDRRLLPQRQQQRRAAPAVGWRHPRR